MVVRAYGQAELTVTRVRNADVNIGVRCVCSRQIRGHRRSSYAVRRNQAPGLASRKLPYAALYIHKEEAHAQRVWVGGSKNVGSIVSVKVAFHETRDVVGSVLAANFQIPA